MIQLQNKNRIKGIIASILVHILLLLVLFFLALTTPLPLPEEEGVEVDLGYSNQGVGELQPESAGGAPPIKQLEAPPSSSAEEEVLTQQTEEAPSIPEQPKPKPEKKKEVKPRMEKHPPQETTESKAEPTPPQPKVDQRALFKGSGDQSGQAGSEGITGQAGDQGKPDGLKNVRRYDGQGGKGDGPSYSLGGRGAVKLAQPKANFREQGDVVVDIWVDRKGLVKRAEVNLRGTTVLDVNLRKLAVNAALSSTFSADDAAADLQKGTITYTFIIGN